MPLNDAYDPQTGEVVDYACASYYMLVDMLAQLTEIATTLNNTAANSAASMLSSEYYHNQDQDGDGLIYGRDFYISTDCPILLKNITPKPGALPMTWLEYQASHPSLF